MVIIVVINLFNLGILVNFNFFIRFFIFIVFFDFVMLGLVNENKFFK